LIVVARARWRWPMTAGPAAGVSGRASGSLTSSDVASRTEIRIGVVADTGSRRPRTVQGAVDGVQAWANYMNANEKGLAGRKIVVDVYDSKLSADDARNSIIQRAARTSHGRYCGAFLNKRRRPRGVQDSKGAATGSPTFRRHPESWQQCAPVSWSINPPVIDCAQGPAPADLSRLPGATNYYLKSSQERAARALPLSVGPESRDLAGPRIHCAAEGRPQQDSTFDVSGRAPQSAYTPFVQAMKDSGATYADPA